MVDFIKVVVTDLQQDSIDIRTGTTNGRDWKIFSQKIYLFLEEQFPVDVVIQLNSDTEKLLAGEYHLTIKSFRHALARGRYDRLELNTNDLIFIPVNVDSDLSKNETIPGIISPKTNSSNDGKTPASKAS